jgi:hypothetical protein
MKRFLIILFLTATASAGTGYTVTRRAEEPFFEFIQLYDTPTSYSGAGGQVVVVNAGATALEFGTVPSHVHDGATLELDGINSDGGAFAFTTTGTVTFNQAIATANFTAANLLTACATNAGALDFSAASKTLTVEDNAIVSQDYSSDASPTFAGLTITDSLQIKRDTSDISNPPTDAQITSAFGAPASAGDGFVALMDDNDAGANIYIVASTGTTAAAAENVIYAAENVVFAAEQVVYP